VIQATPQYFMTGEARRQVFNQWQELNGERLEGGFEPNISLKLKEILMRTAGVAGSDKKLLPRCHGEIFN
jgi:hypothetical protein